MRQFKVIDTGQGAVSQRNEYERLVRNPYAGSKYCSDQSDQSSAASEFKCVPPLERTFLHDVVRQDLGSGQIIPSNVERRRAHEPRPPAMRCPRTPATRRRRV